MIRLNVLTKNEFVRKEGEFFNFVIVLNDV